MFFVQGRFGPVPFRRGALGRSHVGTAGAVSRRAPDAGFTLIETLVALAVLALSAVSLMGATEAHIARIGALESRAAAQWVAENHLAEMTAGLTPSDTPPPMNGIAFRTAVTHSATSDPDLDRVDIAVHDAADGRSHGLLTGFVDRRAATDPERGGAPG